MGEKTNFKNAHRATMKQAEEFHNSVVDAIEEAVTGGDSALLTEPSMNCPPTRRQWARLTPQQEAVKQLRTEAGVSA